MNRSVAPSLLILSLSKAEEAASPNPPSWFDRLTMRSHSHSAIGSARA